MLHDCRYANRARRSIAVQAVSVALTGVWGHGLIGPYVWAQGKSDGSIVLVPDIPALAPERERSAAPSSISSGTRSTRGSLGYKADVSDAELGQITGADFERAVALLVTIGAGEDEVVIGGASYFGTT